MNRFLRIRDGVWREPVLRITITEVNGKFGPYWTAQHDLHCYIYRTSDSDHPRKFSSKKRAIAAALREWAPC